MGTSHLISKQTFANSEVEVELGEQSGKLDLDVWIEDRGDGGPIHYYGFEDFTPEQVEDVVIRMIRVLSYGTDEDALIERITRRIQSSTLHDDANCSYLADDDQN